MDRRITRRFAAKDSASRSHDIIETTEFELQQSWGRPDEWIEGRKDLWTNDEHVKWLSKGHYETEAGIELFSDDPEAP